MNVVLENVVLTEKPLTRKEREAKIKEIVENRGLINLRKLGLSDYAIVILGSLEHWFKKYPDGFDKHGNDCSDQKNLDGECWTKELPMSKKTFKKYFEEIGLIHDSPDEYLKAKRKFNGRFYASVLDESNHKRTRYYRNHKLAKIIEAVIQLNKNSELALSE